VHFHRLLTAHRFHETGSFEKIYEAYFPWYYSKYTGSPTGNIS
jgi:hypothetical protein